MVRRPTAVGGDLSETVSTVALYLSVASWIRVVRGSESGKARFSRFNRSRPFQTQRLSADDGVAATKVIETEKAMQDAEAHADAEADAAAWP